MLHLLWMFIVGVIVGAIARFIFPGVQHMGFLMTGVLERTSAVHIRLPKLP